MRLISWTLQSGSKHILLSTVFLGEDGVGSEGGGAGSDNGARARAGEVAARLGTGSLADVAGGGEGVGGGNGVDDCKVVGKNSTYGVSTGVSLSGRAGVVNMDSWCGDSHGSSFDSEDGAGEDGSTGDDEGEN